MRAIDVARFFVEAGSKKSMSNMKLNKLVYLAQAWSLARNGKPLFDEEIQAWEYGPVIPEVYREYKQYGSNLIPPTHSFDFSQIDAETYELLLDVAREYMHYPSGSLVNLTHASGGPWDTVYKKCKRGGVISLESILSYYQKKNPLNSFNIGICEEFTGYRDDDGVLVLPKELDDDAEEMGDLACPGKV